MSVRFLDLQRIHARQREALLETVTRVIDSGWYVLGKEVDCFEQAFADFCGVRHCIGVGNGLDALVLILRALIASERAEQGDEVIVPGNTFAATLLAVELAGLRPVLVDPDPLTHNLHADAVLAALTERTRVLLPVHLYGRLAPMPALLDIAERHNLSVVEDAAQAHGARVGDRRSGSFGIAAGFSFYPGKNLGALGDGGAITTSDDTLAEAVRAMRNYGSSRKYVHEIRGVNSRLDELQAAILSRKLQTLDADNTRRRRIAERYCEALSGLPGLTTPSAPEDVHAHVWHLYVVRHAARDELLDRLGEKGVETLIHYPLALAEQPAWRGEDFGDLTQSKLLAGSVLSLPIDPSMDESEVDLVISAMKSACVELAR